MPSLKQTSQEFRTKFLLKFTERLIENSKTPYIIALELQAKKIREEKNEQIEQRQKQLQELKKPIPTTNKIILKPLQPSQKQAIRQKYQSMQSSFNQIPIPSLPSTVRNIRPLAQPMPNIDFGKISPLIKDPTVNIIECSGAGKNIIVKRFNGESRQTSIILTKEEIGNIINTFSFQAKIPLEEGVFKVALGNLILSAVISDVVSSKFIISKLR